MNAPTTPTAQSSTRTGWVVAVTDGPHGAQLRVDDAEGSRAVVLPVRPDRAAAVGRLRSARRISWVSIDFDEVEPGRSRGVMICTPHRLPVRSAISLAAALGLTRLGVPTLVRTVLSRG